MVKNKIFVYAILLATIFFSLFFIMGQNQEYREAQRIETKLYQRIQGEVSSYHEGLYQIEQNKKSLMGNPSSQKLEIGSTVLSSKNLSKGTNIQEESSLKP